MKERLAWLDTAKGLAIILVMLGHRNLPEQMVTYFYGFHIPLFFFVSGYLYAHGAQRGLLSEFRQKLGRIIIPYFVVTAVSIVFDYAHGIVSRNYVMDTNQLFAKIMYLDGHVIWNTSLWFLPCFFLVSFAFSCISRVVREKMLLMTVLGLMAGVGFLHSIYFHDLRLIWGADIALVALLFYGVGYLLDGAPLFIRGTKSSVSFIVIGLIVSVAGSFLNGRINMYTHAYGNPFLFVATAFGGIFFICGLAVNIPLGRLPGFFGRHTFLLFSTHMMTYQVLEFGLKKARIYDTITAKAPFVASCTYVAVTLMLTSALILAVNRFASTRRLIGKYL